MRHSTKRCHFDRGGLRWARTNRWRAAERAAGVQSERQTFARRPWRSGDWRMGRSDRYGWRCRCFVSHVQLGRTSAQLARRYLDSTTMCSPRTDLSSTISAGCCCAARDRSTNVRLKYGGCRKTLNRHVTGGIQNRKSSSVLDNRMPVRPENIGEAADLDRKRMENEA